MQHHLHAAFDIADLQRAAMQLHHFLDKIEAQASTFAPTGRAWQRIETLAQAWQGVVGDRRGLVEQAHLHVVVPCLCAEPQQATGRREVQRIVQQVAQCLA